MSNLPDWVRLKLIRLEFDVISANPYELLFRSRSSFASTIAVVRFVPLVSICVAEASVSLRAAEAANRLFGSDSDLISEAIANCRKRIDLAEKEKR